MKDKGHDVHTKNRIEVHRTAEQEQENRHRRPLRHRAAQAKENTLQRVRSVDRDRCQSLGRMMGFVDGPQQGPMVHPSVQKVFGKIIKNEDRNCEQGNNHTYRGVREYAPLQECNVMQRVV